MTDNLGLLLKKLLKDRSLTISKFSELTEIDKATISRIINGKRKANPGHLQKFADCLEIPIAELFAASGIQIKPKQDSDIHTSVDSIQKTLESSDLYDCKFSIESVEKQLDQYHQFVQTEDGKEYILNNFEEKLQKVGGIGPFINQLNEMFVRFRLKRGKSFELALIGSALIYFIIPGDIIPDYIFPFGYIDDAMAVQIVSNLLKTNI